MYRYLSLILLLWLSYSHTYSQSVDLTVQDATVNSGDNICLDVYVDGFDDLISLQFGITYDPALLEFDQITNINGGAISGLSIGNFGTPPGTPDGEIRFSWDDPTTTGVSAPDGTRMFQVCFNVIGAGGNTTNVTIEGLPTLTMEAFNADLNQVPVNSSGGEVIIQGGGGPDLDVSITSALGDQGTVVCVTVRVSNFENMTLFNHALTWNTAVATFSSINNVYPGLIGLNLSNVDGPPTTPPGEIHFNWEDPTPPDGETIPDNSNLYQACFELTGDPGTSTFLRIESTPSQMVEAENEEGPVQVAASIGTLTINGSSGPGDFTINVSDITVNEGDQACVTYSVDNFEDILAAQWGITWDTTKLQFDSITNLNSMLPGLSLGGFGTPPSTQNGRIRFSWDDPMAVGQSLPDGSELFDVCFTAIGAAGMSSAVNAEDLPGFAIEVFDGGGNELDVVTENGSVTIEGNIPDTAFTILVNDLTVNPGDTACLEVSVRNFEDLIALQYGITWDTTLLEFVEIRNINSSALQGLGPGSFGTPPGTMNGTIRFSWDDPTAQGQSVMDNTILYEVCFVAIGGNGSVAPVDIASLTNFMIEAYNTTEQIQVATDNGSVTIDDDSGGEPDTLMIDGGSAMVPTGDTVCVPVTVENFENLVSLQFGMTYNSARLKYVSIQNLNSSVEGLDVGDIQAPPTTSAGQIRFNWNDPDDSGESLPDGSTLFEVCFEAVGAAGTTSFFNVLGLDAFPVEAEDTAGVVPTITSNGLIEITDTVSTGSDLMITGSEESGENGDTVCVDITVENFTDLLVLQHALTWDTGILEFVSIENIYGSLPGLSQGSFGTPPGTPNGQIRFSWDDPTATGQSVPDGTVLFSVCFEIIGNSGSMSGVNITGVPGFSIEAINSDNDEVNVVADNGKVTVTGIPDGLTFALDDGSGCTGDTVCVDFTVNDFNSILVMQLPIVFDEAALDAVGVQNIFSTLPGLSTGSFGFTTAGEVRISWDDPNATGQTVPDGTVLFSLCFEILAEDGETADLSIENVPGFDIEIFDGNGDQLSPSLINGTIEVSCAADPLMVSDVVIVDETCSGDKDGSIDITVVGGTPPYMYTWVGPNGFMSNDEDITGLESGFYTVAITDSSVPTQSIIRNYQISTTGSSIQLDGFSTTAVACKGDSTGVIDLTISGVGNNPEYLWGPGTWPNSPDLINAPAGSYQVTISDDADCPVVFGPFTITEPFQNIAISSFEVTDVDCHGDASGAIDITVMNGTPPYNYEWSHLTGVPNDPEDPQDLEGGQYSVTITDVNGCDLVSGTFTVNEPPMALTINDVTISPETPITDNGSIEISVSGGTGNYTYSWNGPSCSPMPCTTEDIFNLSEGNYTLTLTDENGCTLTETFTVPFSMITLVVDNVVDVACEGDNTGAISITVTGGEGPFEFTWRGPNNFGSALEDITGLKAGDYNLTITDIGAPGSFFTTTITVNTLSNLSIAASVESNYNGFGVRCFGGSDGIVSVEAFNGAQPYTYSWSNGEEDNMIFDLSAGQYTVTVTDEVGCSRVASITLNQPTFIEPSIQLTTNASCNDACDGEARVDPTGGLPPYSIRWGNNQTTRQADSLCVGFNFVTITDFNGCMMVDSLNIRQNEIIVTHEELPDPNDPDRLTVRLDVTGGTRPYTYLWEDPVQDDDNFVSNLLPGLYRVLVVDANGCEVLYEFTIESNPECFEDVRNVISPNDDGRNETFIITCADIPTFIVRLEIYNRWGQLIYDTDDYNNDWNGVNNSNEPLPDGVYYYFFEVDMGLPSPSERRQGSITLLR